MSKEQQAGNLDAAIAHFGTICAKQCGSVLDHNCTVRMHCTDYPFNSGITWPLENYSKMISAKHRSGSGIFDPQCESRTWSL